MDKRRYLPYNILDLTGYGVLFNISDSQFVALMEDIITNGHARYTLSDTNETDIANKIIKTDVPLNVLTNIPDKIQRVKAFALNRIGYMNVDIVEDNKVFSMSQYWVSNGVILQAYTIVDGDNVDLSIHLVVNHN